MKPYDPFMHEVVADDPYPVYHRLREHSPRLFRSDYNAWFMSSFDDVWNLLKDERLSVAAGLTPTQLLLGGAPDNRMISQMDPPTHTRFRSAFNTLFKPAAVQELDGKLRASARTAIRSIAARGEFDVLADYAGPLACDIACVLSGLPREDLRLFMEWIGGFFHREDDVRGDTAVGQRAGTELWAYIGDFLRKLRRDPSTASGSAAILLEMSRQDPTLGDDDLVSMLANIQIAASDTVPKGIAASLFRLWQHPEQRALMVAEPALADAAFNEAVRLDMPTQMQGRVCLDGFAFRDVRIEAGQRVMMMFAAANRDPSEFDDPDTFRLQRQARRTLNYGNGLHRCLGVHLAVLEGRVALQELLGAFPCYEIDVGASFAHRTEYVKGWAKLAARAGPISSIG